MTFITTHHIRTSSFFISKNESAAFPVRTCNILIIVILRFTPVILPIMCKRASRFIMTCIIRTPNSFKMVNIKLSVSGNFVNQVNFDVLIIMCKTTKLSIIAILKLIWIKSTKFSFIFFRMIQLLNSIMRKQAQIILLACFLILTHIKSISLLPSFISKRMIELAMFRIMLLRYFTLINFKCI